MTGYAYFSQGGFNGAVQGKVWLARPYMHKVEQKYTKKAFELYPAVRLVVAHLYGTPGKMDEIRKICNERNELIVDFRNEM